MRRIPLLLTSTTLVVLLATGIAMAYGGIVYNTIRCEGGVCKGTPKNDQMRGTLKRDVMYGFKGYDKLYGKDAKDDLFGFDGNDSAYGGDGNDKLSGGNDRDHLWAGDGSDSLSGGYGQDDLYGQEGNDVLTPGPDDDPAGATLNGGAGDDQLKEGPSGSTFVFGSDWGDDTISVSNPRSEAYSTVDFVNVPQDLRVDLNPGDGPEVADGVNTVEWSDSNIRNVDGGSGADTIVGNELRNVLYGNGGANTVHGGGGNDSLDSLGCGSRGDVVDRLYGGEGNDDLHGWCGGDHMDGGPGDDRMENTSMQSGDDTMEGGPGDDYMFPTGGMDTVRGGDGNDRIKVDTDWGQYLGGDDVEGGPGDDTIEANDGTQDTIDCGDGVDDVAFDAGKDTLTNCENMSTTLASGAHYEAQDCCYRDLNNEFTNDGGTTWEKAFVYYVYPAGQIDGTQFISSNSTGSGPQGTTRYRTVFDLPSGFANPSLDLLVHADNYATIYLNGVEIGQQPQGDLPENYQGEPETFSVNDPSLFRGGSNTLEFRITNTSQGLTAFDYKAVIVTN